MASLTENGKVNDSAHFDLIPFKSEPLAREMKFTERGLPACLVIYLAPELKISFLGTLAGVLKF